MRRLLAPVCVVLLAVLTGTPVAAIVCAEWCDSSGGVATHRAHVTAVQGETLDCHGGASDGPRVGGDVAPECQTSGVADSLTALITSYRHDTAPPAIVRTTAEVLIGSAGLTSGFPPSATPPGIAGRPASSRLVLRI